MPFSFFTILSHIIFVMYVTSFTQIYTVKTLLATSRNKGKAVTVTGREGP
jgi:hypothetical protein